MICTRCQAETYRDDQPTHKTDADCTLAWRTLLAECFLPINVARVTIERCRNRKHIGNPVMKGKDVCTRCLAAGYTAYAQIERKLGFFSSSETEAQKGANGGEQRADSGHGTAQEPDVLGHAGPREEGRRNTE